MDEIPTDKAQTEIIRAAIAENPLLADKLASQDGTAVVIYVPIQAKDQARRIAADIAPLAEAELGANIFNGSRIGMFGMLGDNDNVYLSMRYAF